MKALLERYAPTDKLPSRLAHHGVIHSHQNEHRYQVPVARGSPLSLPQPEHQLRRKSPNETVINNGYDASPTTVSSGPPPPKLMRRLQTRGKSQNSGFLGDWTPQAPVLVAESLPNGAHLSHRTVSQPNVSGSQFAASHNNEAGIGNTIDPTTKQALVEQLYFSKIDDRLTHLTPAQGNTCRWFLNKSEYVDWRNNDKRSEHSGSSSPLVPSNHKSSALLSSLVSTKSAQLSGTRKMSTWTR
ncbi:hypothetical protein BJX70DRAFT_314333 [Aspergillus crustosus]